MSLFIDIINADVINRYNLVDKFGRGSSLKFNFIVSDFSRHEIQTEMIKFLCNLHKVDQRLNFISLFERYLEFFSPFNESTTDEGYFDSSKYLLSLKNISFISDFLPFIFESYPNIYAKYWQSFFSFTMDFLNMIVNDKGSYVKLSKLLSLTPPKTYFQSKFYKSSFCSLIKTLRVILKNDVDIVRPYFGDVIVTCTNNLKSGIGYLETIHVLSLLNDTLEKMKLYEINLILKDKNIDNLYSIDSKILEQ